MEIAGYVKGWERERGLAFPFVPVVDKIGSFFTDIADSQDLFFVLTPPDIPRAHPSKAVRPLRPSTLDVLVGVTGADFE